MKQIYKVNRGSIGIQHFIKHTLQIWNNRATLNSKPRKTPVVKPGLSAYTKLYTVCRGYAKSYLSYTILHCIYIIYIIYMVTW